jgi:hypothetical protein
MFSSAGQCFDPDGVEYPPTPAIKHRGIGQNARSSYLSGAKSLVVIVIVVVMLLYPFPLIVDLAILSALGVFKAPVVALLAPTALMPLVPLIVVLLRIHPIVMFGECLFGILAFLAVAVRAGRIVLPLHVATTR